MRKLILAGIICLSAAACQTPQQSAGTATGVAAGAIVGGPVGAVVGGAVGATVTAPGGPLSPGYCYVQNRRGQFLRDRSGQPLVQRCA
jgi:osmotically inducible lipoprotein OsmB